MVKDKKMEECFKLMERLADLEVQRATLMKESLKSKDTNALVESMNKITEEMTRLQEDMENFLDNNNIPPMKTEKMEIDRDSFSTIFSKN